jgi:hypothetical protein
LLSATVSGKHDLVALQSSLHKNNQIHCGPDNGPGGLPVTLA